MRKELKLKLEGQKVLLIAPGASLKQNENTIKEFIEKKNPIVVGINFEYENIKNDYVFFANQKRYKKYKNEKDIQIIISSNVKPRNGKELTVNYDLIVQRGWKNFDNAMIMILRLLENMDVEELYIAGFDGFDTNAENFVHAELEMAGGLKDYKKINAEICVMFSNVKKAYYEKGIKITFLTDSIYDV